MFSIIIYDILADRNKFQEKKVNQLTQKIMELAKRNL